MKRFLFFCVALIMFCSCDVYEHSSQQLNELEQQVQTEKVVRQEAYHVMTKNWVLMLFYCVMIVEVVCIACFLLFARYSVKTGKKIDDERRKRQQLQADYEQISERIKDKEKSISIMSDYIYNHLSIASKLQGINDSTRTIWMTELDWLELEVYLNTTHRHFVKTFRECHPEACQEILRFCMLLRLELTNKQVATIYHIAEKSVKQKAYLYKNQLSDIPSNMSLRTYIYSWNSTGHPLQTSESPLTTGGGDKEESKRGDGIKDDNVKM